MKKPSIPSVNIPDQRIAALLRPMKENIEILTGIRGEKLRKVSVSNLIDVDQSAVNDLYTQVLREEALNQTAALNDIVVAMYSTINNLNALADDDIFWCGQCPFWAHARDDLIHVAHELGERVTVREVITDDRAIMRQWGIANGVFIDGQCAFLYPPSKDELRKALQAKMN